MGVEKKTSLKDRLFCFNKKSEEKYTIEDSPNDSSDQRGTLEVHRGQLSPEDYERRKIQYELFETYREIALLKDSDLNPHDDKLLTYVRNVKSVEDTNVKYTAIETLKTQVKSIQVKLAQNMADLRLKLEQIGKLKLKIKVLEEQAQKSYKQISTEIKQKNEKNNEYMLAISQCQVDLIDLRKQVRMRNIELTRVSTMVSIAQSKLEKVSEKKDDSIDLPEDEEDDEEQLALVNEINNINKEVSELELSLQNESWAKIFEMMKHKLEEDDKDTENEEELARILSEFEAFIKGSGKVNVDIDVDIKLKLEADIKVLEMEISQFREQIRTKNAEIKENEENIAEEKAQLDAIEAKLVELQAIHKENALKLEAVTVSVTEETVVTETIQILLRFRTTLTNHNEKLKFSIIYKLKLQ